MRKGLPSASRLGRAFKCLGSTVLPQAEHESERGERGTVKHLYLATLVSGVKPEEAIKHVPEEFRDECLALNFPELNLHSVEAESGLVYDVETEEVRPLGHAKGRNYGELGPNEIAMSIDALGWDSEAVYVYDWKTGRGYVPPAEHNWQLKVAAIAACKWRGLSLARVGIVRVLEDGTTTFDTAEFDLFQLDWFASSLRVLAKSIQVERESHERGEIQVERESHERGEFTKDKPFRLTTGEHCRYCPSFAYCPAQTSLIRAIAAEPGRLANEIKEALTPETAAKAYARVRAVQQSMSFVIAALKMYAEENPIDLGDGRVYGAVEKKVEELDGKVARDQLALLYGPEVADVACSFETSKAAIDRAVRKAKETDKRHEVQASSLKSLNAAALEAIRQAGGVLTKYRTEIREYETRKRLIVDVRQGESEAEAEARSLAG